VVPAVAVLITEGVHVPVINSVELTGKVPGVAPSQYGPKAINEGVTGAFTVIPIVFELEGDPVAQVSEEVNSHIT
jgi:hypothetical protein